MRSPPSKPQLRPNKHQQNSSHPQPSNPRIQHHPSPPPFPLTHPLQQPHSLPRRLHAPLILIQALRSPLQRLVICGQRIGELSAGCLESAGEGEQGAGDVRGFCVVGLEEGCCVR